jgi:hypothetical protein
MKKIVALLTFLSAALIFADNGSIFGQKMVRQTLITWTAGSNTGKTHGILLGNNVYIDTSTTGQTNQFRRVDNTADSCSDPFFIASDSLAGARPVWEYRLWGMFRSVDKDSSTHVYRVQTREVRFVKNRTISYTAWTRAGTNSGYLDVTVQDTLVIPNIGTVARIPQYTLGMFAGTQARLCPDDIAGTANAATDTVHFDSLTVYTR